MTPQQIKQLHDLLSAQAAAGLVDDDEWRARRKELYDQVVTEAAKRTEERLRLMEEVSF